jgi:Uncharacterized protein conserved in bacteria
MVGQGLKPCIFFSNSNIVPFDEYALRREELKRFASSFGLETVDDDYDHREWLAAVKGLEREPERGARCLQCFRFRLLRAAEYASANGYTLLTTTLASSRWKNLGQVDEAGRWAVEKVASGASALRWWGQNWRKGGLQERRCALIHELGMYNQDWCGCEFSRREPALGNGDSE